MNVAQRREGCLQLAHRLVDIPRFETRASKALLRRGGAHGRCLSPADAEGDAAADAIVIEHELAGGGDKREIALPYAHFVKAGADAAGVAPQRKTHLSQAFL